MRTDASTAERPARDDAPAAPAPALAPAAPVAPVAPIEPAAPIAPAAPILVLGLGNLLLRDDGVGLELLRRLAERHSEREAAVDVDFVDGGTQGVALLGQLDERRAVLVLDAVSVDANGPGEVAVVRDPLAHPTARGMGAHGANASGLLASAQLLGQLPPRAVVVGVGPDVLETGIGLSPRVSAALPDALSRAEEILAELCEDVVREREPAQGAAPCTR